MPASFKVRTVALDEDKFEEVLDPDFGESAIGRVAPVDSGKFHLLPSTYEIIFCHCCVESVFVVSYKRSVFSFLKTHP